MHHSPNSGRPDIKNYINNYINKKLKISTKRVLSSCPLWKACWGTLPVTAVTIAGKHKENVDKGCEGTPMPCYLNYATSMKHMHTKSPPLLLSLNHKTSHVLSHPHQLTFLIWRLFEKLAKEIAWHKGICVYFFPVEKISKNQLRPRGNGKNLRCNRIFIFLSVSLKSGHLSTHHETWEILRGGT